MQQPDTYDSFMAAAEKHLKERNVHTALDLFKQATIAARQKVLICQSMLGNHKAALEQFNILRLEAAQFGPLCEGDIIRDYVFALIRDPQTTKQADRKELTEKLLQEATDLHKDDKNRLACLIGAQARLAFITEDYAKAAQLHKKANELWKEIGDNATPQWIYNNLPHWQLAAAAIGDAATVQELGQRIIAGKSDYGSDQHLEHAQQLMQHPDSWQAIVAKYYNA